MRAKEQNVHVLRRMQTLVGLMCWFDEKKTRSPFFAIGRVGQLSDAEQVVGLEQLDTFLHRQARHVSPRSA